MAKAADVIPPLLDALGLSSTNALELSLGLTDHPIAKLLRRDSDLSVIYIMRILDKYPDVNPAFLVTGRGTVILSKSAKKALGL